MSDYLVLIADQSRARAFTRDRKFSPLVPIRDFDNENGRRHLGEIVTDRSGTSFPSAGSGRDAMDDGQAIMDAEAQRFASQLVDWLERRHREKSKPRVIVSAAPRFLGQLRQARKGRLDDYIDLELDKDLVQGSDEEIQRSLDDALGR